MSAALTGTPEISSIKTLGRDDELKQAQCGGKYSFTYNGKPRELDTIYEVAFLQDKGESEVKVNENSVIAMMQHWADYLDAISPGKKVVTGKFGKAA